LLAGFGIARGIARRIEQSEREASRAEQLAAVGQLASGLAHELRNPLTAIRVLVEAGREQTDGVGLEPRDLEVVSEEIERLEKLASSFLDFSRPPEIEKSTIDARSLVDQTLQLCAGTARQRGAILDWQKPADAVSVDADPVQMRQVILNLVLNALDAIDADGKVTLTIDHAAGEQKSCRTGGARNVSITIADNGPGVPDDMKEKIFEPFLSSKETGVGLGLAVSRRIVEAHGGTLLVTDNPGRGARFTIYLPDREN
jgi:signal transduction histidine kinase